MQEVPSSPKPAARPAPTPPQKHFNPLGVMADAKPIMTMLIIAANVAVWGLMVAQGVDFLNPDANVMIEWGADFSPLTFNGEWWRAFTSMWLHFGIIHLGMNMYILWGTGRLVERLFGSAGYLAVYIAAGLAGAIASSFFSTNGVGAGASGAVFGVFGGLAAFVLRRRKQLGKGMVRHLRGHLMSFVVLNLVLGFGVNAAASATGIGMRIGNAAHIGGAIGGFIFGLLLVPNSPVGSPKRTIKAALALVLALGIAFSYFGLNISAPPSVDPSAALSEVSAKQDEALAMWQDMSRRLEADEIDEAGAAIEINQRIIPTWDEAQAAFDASEASLPVRVKANMSAYLRLQRQSFELYASGYESGDLETKTRASERGEEAETARRRTQEALE